MKKELDQINLIDGDTFLLDKPLGWTSFALVHQLKKWTKAKTGHAGTLDPLASGLMILCTGKQTKSLTGLTGLQKEYTGIIQLGAITPTYDLESQPENFKPTTDINDTIITETIRQFTGDIFQKPPVHAAIKQDGKPIYLAARKGETVELVAKPKTVFYFDIEQRIEDELHFRIACSSGTYIRSLAHDLGQTLGCGAYLKALRRTKIGDFRIEDSYTVDEMADFFGSRIQARIIKPYHERIEASKDQNQLKK